RRANARTRRPRTALWPRLRVRRSRRPPSGRLRIPDVELLRGRVLGRAPRLRVVRRDVVVELPADLLEQRVVADLVDGLLEVLVHLDVVAVQVLESEEPGG